VGGVGWGGNGWRHILQGGASAPIWNQQTYYYTDTRGGERPESVVPFAPPLADWRMCLANGSSTPSQLSDAGQFTYPPIAAFPMSTPAVR
jgi:hypothetical protein